ncbi:MAG: thymidine kinase [Bacteroidales bacterium]|nr:thymidine kinase [Bacteroidales bacterium]
MFFEKRVNKHFGGWIEVIVGSMFSGKTEELIRRLKRARIAKLRVEVYKPMVDVRYANEEVVSHNHSSLNATAVESSSQIMLMASDVDVVGIDEAQFFDNGLSAVCNHLANNGIRVIVAGLDMDYKGKPFGPMPELLSTAENITKVHAICMQCGDLAHYSYRKNDDQKLVMLGEQESYDPLCRRCYIDKMASF